MGKIFFERKASLHFPLSAARSTRFGTVPLCLKMVVTTVFWVRFAVAVDFSVFHCNGFQFGAV